jgi:hypothetical protein
MAIGLVLKPATPDWWCGSSGRAQSPKFKLQSHQKTPNKQTNRKSAIPPLTCQYGYYKKQNETNKLTENNNVGDCMENPELLCTAGRKVKWCRHCGQS